MNVRGSWPNYFSWEIFLGGCHEVLCQFLTSYIACKWKIFGGGIVIVVIVVRGGKQSQPPSFSTLTGSLTKTFLFRHPNWSSFYLDYSGLMISLFVIQTCQYVNMQHSSSFQSNIEIDRIFHETRTILFKNRYFLFFPSSIFPFPIRYELDWHLSMYLIPRWWFLEINACNFYHEYEHSDQVEEDTNQQRSLENIY